MIYGLNKVIKGLKEGKIKRVIYAQNTPKTVIEKIKKFNVEIEEFNGNNIELGTKIGRSHKVMVLGLENEDKI